MPLNATNEWNQKCFLCARIKYYTSGTAKRLSCEKWDYADQPASASWDEFGTGFCELLYHTYFLLKPIYREKTSKKKTDLQASASHHKSHKAFAINGSVLLYTFTYSNHKSN